MTAKPFGPGGNGPPFALLERPMPNQTTNPLRAAWLATVLIAPLLAPVDALAIPAFARRYQTSCTTCHVLAPKLNAFGVAFRNNGYRIPPNDERYVRIPDVQLGAPAWKRLWPDAVWPGGVPGAIPIALRLMSDVIVDTHRPATLDFVFPSEFEVLAGGTAGEGISYFAELAVSHDNHVELERAFVQFDQLGSTTLANLVIGRFETRAVPFSHFHRRLTLSDPLPIDARRADGFRLRTPQEGFEFWGAKSGSAGRGGVEYAVGVVNGTGADPETNTAKDLYSRLSYKFGGFGVSGSEESTDELPRAASWLDDSVRIGTSSYVGWHNTGAPTDRFWRLGADVDVFRGSLNVSAHAFAGRDRRLEVSSPFRAAALEANYVVKPWIIGIVRFDTASQDGQRSVRRVVPGVAIAIRANVRVVAEWEAFLKTSFEGSGQASGENRARFRLDLVF
jgi:hypothetical protein